MHHSFPQRSTFRATSSVFLVCALVWGVSCGEAQTSHPQPDFPQDSILAPETVEMTFFDEGLPEFSTTEDGEVVTQGLEGIRTAEQGVVGQRSRVVDPVIDGLKAANSMIQPWLRVVREITQRSPDLSDERVRVWRFTGEYFVYAFYVETREEAPGRFEYALLKTRRALQESSPELVMSGFFTPGSRTEDGKQTGEGVIRYRYGAFTPNVGAQGVGAFSFRITPQVREFQVLFHDFQMRPTSQALNARYAYRLRADQTGQFTFALQGDILDQLPGQEVLRQGVVWNADRSGRGFASLASESFTGELLLDECWDPNLLQVWTRWNAVPDGDANDGDRARCGVFQDVRPDLPNTRFVEREETPEIPRGE